MSHEPETCVPVHELIALDAGGDLDGALRQSLADHLAACSGCRDFAAAMDRSQRAVRALATEPVGGDLQAEVRAAVLKEIDGAGRRPAILRFARPRARPLRRWLAAAAAVLLTVGVGWWRASRPPPPRWPRVVRHQPPPASSVAPPPAVAETVALPAAPPSPQPPPPAVAEVQPPPRRPMLVRWYVDDPDLVIYWLIDTDEPTEETTHEPTET